MEDKFSFPLEAGQLYTPYDLTLRAWTHREAVKNAQQKVLQDPFTRINVDPYWEYKVTLSEARE